MAHHRPAVLALPMPSGSGTSAVMAYLLPGSRPVLVDAGPGTDAGETALISGLQAAGVRMADIRLVFVTHSHPNHSGGVARVVREAGAKVVAHPLCAAAMADWRGTTGVRAQLLRRAGHAGAVPSGIAERAADRILGEISLGENVHESSFAGSAARGHLRAGSASWNVLHTPGHIRDHQCLYHGPSGVLLSGDVLVRDAEVVPWLEARRRDGSRPGTLSAQITSWRRLARLNVSLAWPGHGPAIRAHRMLIARRLAHARSLVAGTRSALLDGATSVWDVMTVLHGRVDDSTLAAVLSQTVAALDWLAAKGEATRRTAGGLVLYGVAAPRRRG